MSNAWARGSTKRWRVIRAMVLARDGYRCRAHADGWCARAQARDHVCAGRAPLRGRHAGHAHHTMSRSVTGDDPAYIVAACAPCNLAIGDPLRVPDPPVNPITRW